MSFLVILLDHFLISFANIKHETVVVVLNFYPSSQINSTINCYIMSLVNTRSTDSYLILIVVEPESVLNNAWSTKASRIQQTHLSSALPKKSILSYPAPLPSIQLPIIVPILHIAIASKVKVRVLDPNEKKRLQQVQLKRFFLFER